MNKDREQFEVYVTKYFFAKGIQKRIVETTFCENMVSDIEFTLLNYHGEGNEWHRTFESAVKRAKEMQKKKILSLEKQLKKIRNISFELREKK